MGTLGMCVVHEDALFHVHTLSWVSGFAVLRFLAKCMHVNATRRLAFLRE